MASSGSTVYYISVPSSSISGGAMTCWGKTVTVVTRGVFSIRGWTVRSGKHGVVISMGADGHEG